MKLLDERAQVRSVAGRFRDLFGDGSYPADKRGRQVGLELSQLDAETATAADVAEIIGNSSWVMPTACSECRTETWQIVEVGEEDDHESATAWLCADCLRKALALVSKSTA